MRIWSDCRHLPVALILFLPAAVSAQIVQIGPGYVRAPFVRVFRTPGGGTQVRAPFVDVHSPPHRYHRRPAGPVGRIAPQPALNPPPPIDDDGLGGTQLQRQRGEVFRAAVQLEQSLERLQHGERWADYLSLPQSFATPVEPEGDSSAVAAAEAQDLRVLLARFDRLRSNRRYRAITRLTAFDTTRRAMQAYLVLLEEADAEVLPPPVELAPPRGF